jgi:TRAP-type C4-dicarboxylate transport system permease small subunit
MEKEETHLGLFHRLTAATGRLASLFFLVIIVITAFEVTARYVFDAPTVWVHEVSVLLAAAAFLLGGPFVHQERGHIVITALYDRLPMRARHWANVFVSLLSLAFLCFLAYAAGMQAYEAIQINERSGTALNWPTPTWLKALFALAALFMALQTLLHLRADVKRLRDLS